MIFKVLTAMALFVVFSGCGKDDPEKIAEKDRETILKYLRDNEIEATEHDSGIFFNITREGSGGYPTIASTVQITYVGTILGGKQDGKVFDTGFSSSLRLQNTIRGWQFGIPLFNRGSKGFLIIPSGLAYGQYPPYFMGIPQNAILIFEIELEDFQ